MDEFVREGKVRHVGVSTYDASERGITVGQLAIAWTLANSSVQVSIVGARNPEQIAQTAPAAEVELSAEELHRIDEILRDEVAVGGPAPEAMP